jgi:glutamate dehydrogenase
LNKSSQLDGQEGVKLITQTGVPEELAKKLFFIAALQDFPFMVLLAIETQQDFNLILTLLNDVNKTLGLHEISQQLVKIPRRDFWVKSVCNALQADILKFTAQLIKKILLSQEKNCSEYIDIHLEKYKIKRYRNIYLENQKIKPVNLLAYVSLIRELEHLLDD